MSECKSDGTDGCGCILVIIVLVCLFVQCNVVNRISGKVDRIEAKVDVLIQRLEGGE